MTFGTHNIPVRETDYVEGGLGWRVWASGVVMCRELMARHAQLRVAGADVLEVGAGCGVVGFLAARLGARRVTFTDYLPGLLSNLDRSVDMNRLECPDTTFRVNHLEWLSAAPRELAEAHATSRPMGGDGSCAPVADSVATSVADRALSPEERFQLILGSDVCYEDPLPMALAHVLSQRLEPTGLAWLVLPVRDWPNEKGMAVIERLASQARELGMVVNVEKAPDLEEDEYDGGTMVAHSGGMVHVWLRHNVPSQ